MRFLLILKKDGDDLKGEFLSAHNRIKYLKRLFQKTDFVPLLIKEYDGFFLRLIKRSKRREKYPAFVYGGIDYRVVWVKSLLMDSLFFRLFRFKPLLLFRLRLFAKKLSPADLIISHSFYPGFIARTAFLSQGIHYTVTWHGSDIHSGPRDSLFARIATRRIIEDASVNYFVSRNLLDSSSYITTSGKKMVLYNGVDESQFKRYSTEKKQRIRMGLGIHSHFNVAFIGNLYPIKNVMVLPSIFKRMAMAFGEEIGFHIVGDGFLRNRLEGLFCEQNVTVRFWGNVMPQMIPDIINVMDLIVLPSKNEGLPLIAVESLACGTPLLGSDVGGIKEVVGEEYVVPLNELFIDSFVDKAIKILNNRPRVVLNGSFLWDNSAQIEKSSLDSLNIR